MPDAYKVETSLVTNAEVGRTYSVGFGGWHDVLFGWQTNTSKNHIWMLNEEEEVEFAAGGIMSQLRCRRRGIE